MDDLWLWCVDFRLTPWSALRYGENEGKWQFQNQTNWGKDPGSARPPGRRAHASCFVNGKLYIFGGQTFEGGTTYESMLSGRELRSSSRIMGDI